MDLRLKFIGINENDVIATSCTYSNDPVVVCYIKSTNYYIFYDSSAYIGGIYDDNHITNLDVLEEGKKYHIHKVSDTSFTFELCEDSSHSNYANSAFFGQN